MNKTIPIPIQPTPRRHPTGLLTGKLARASGLMFVSTVGGGILGYVFQILMGRMLSVPDYGLFITLMALLAVVGVPLGTLSMVVSRRASGYRAKNQPERMAAMFWWVNRRMLWVALAVVLCTLPLTPWLRDSFHLLSIVPVWIFLLIAFTVLFGPVNIAFLQAQQNFRWLTINGLAVHGFKILFCGVLVYAGLNLNGALMGIVLASLAAWLLTYWPLRHSVTLPAGTTVAGGHLSFRGVIPVLIANLSFAVMTQLDIILVNHYYNTHQAGVYAAAAILGKAVMYLPGAIAIAMFPMVAENESRALGSAHLFFNAMALTAGLSGAGALFYFLFADNIMTLFYGQKYQGAAELLKLYGFAMLPMTLVMVAEHFLIAKGRVIFAYVMMFGIPFVLLAAQTYHDHLIDMVYILAACGWGLALVGFAVIGTQYWQSRE
ncbi:MAG: oligosaccharide flippase family protein [Burkholderiales bacterium]